MRGIKPFKLSFITRPFSWGQQHHLGIGVLAYARLGPPELFTDFEMWNEVSALLGKDAVLDAGLPKSRSEFLLVGSAHQPGGAPGTTCPVTVRVGDMQKRLYVIGDRFWKNQVPTEPQPFVEMPLGWQNAFGGEGFDKNPLGKGFALVKDVRPLPNLELPGQMIKSEKDRPEPAGFGPVDFIWPQRFSLAGTYDKRWMETRFPGYAEDMDWRIWNLAPPDQQREQQLVGDEEIVCENVHPTKSKLTGRLPGLTARCWVLHQRSKTTTTFDEVGLRLTTVWLLPAIERVILVWHGAHPVYQDDGDDVKVLMIAGEKIGEPRPLAHYQAVFAKRTGENRALEVLNDPDLFPADWSGMGPDVDAQLKATTPENLLHDRQRAIAAKTIEEARAQVAALGLDPDEHGPQPLPPPEPLPPLSELGSFVDAKKKEAEQARERGEAYSKNMHARVKEFYEGAGLSYEALLEEMKDFPRGPPPFRAADERKRMQKLADDARAAGQPVPELDEYATSDERYQLWVMREDSERQMYLSRAHLQHPLLPVANEVAAERRAAALEMIRRGDSLVRVDFTGVDLRGVDLSGRDLTEAYLESANLEGALLRQCNLTRAVLARASLSAADASGALFHGANVGAAVFRGANLTGARFTEATLHGIDLRGADATSANFELATLETGELAGLRLQNANLRSTNILNISLANVDLRGADLTQATFYRVDISDLDLSGATMVETTFVSVRGVGARFVNANLTGFRAVEGCTLEKADMRGANLSKANFRDFNLRGSDLSGALLDGADLSGADLTDAKLYRIRARKSSWVRATLRNAFMISADLFEAILEKADIRGADMRGANLYAADFALVHGDAKTTVEGAIQDKVRYLPLRDPNAPGASDDA